jgi:hypothetical protein
MKKTKEGKVIATLTEVKNKTGDIFSLADTYGEVLLTSYNKPKYKIVRIDVSDRIDTHEGQETQAKKAPLNRTQKQSTTKAPKSEVRVVTESSEKIEVKQNATIDFTVWDRNSIRERAFTANSIRNLVA